MLRVSSLFRNDPHAGPDYRVYALPMTKPPTVHTGVPARALARGGLTSIRLLPVRRERPDVGRVGHTVDGRAGHVSGTARRRKPNQTAEQFSASATRDWRGAGQNMAQTRAGCAPMPAGKLLTQTSDEAAVG